MRVALGGVLAGVALALAVPAAPALAAGSLGVSPSSATAGSPVTLTFTNYGIICWIDVTWDSQSGQRLANVPPWTKSVVVTVPDSAAPGVHTIHTTQCLGKLQATLEVTVPPKPPVPRPTPVPPASPAPHPSRPGVPGQTPSPGASPKPSPTRRGGVLTLPPVVPAQPLPPIRLSGVLQLDRDVVRPGEQVTARGSGCTPGGGVYLTSDGETLGAATADGTGAFVAKGTFRSAESGRRVVTARCGVELIADVDVVVDTANSSPLGAAVPLFLLTLLGTTAVGWQHASVRSRPEPSADEPPGGEPPAELPTAEQPTAELPTAVLGAVVHGRVVQGTVVHSTVVRATGQRAPLAGGPKRLTLPPSQPLVADVLEGPAGI